jgi:hypothetical protein
MVVKTVRPKKNGSPQSNDPEFGPAIWPSTDNVVLFRNGSAFWTDKLKAVVMPLPPRLVAARVSSCGAVEGKIPLDHYQSHTTPPDLLP